MHNMSTPAPRPPRPPARLLVPIFLNGRCNPPLLLLRFCLGQPSLAQYYQDMNDPKTGVYFHEKCLEISRLTNDRRGEMSANHRLGLVYDKMVGIFTCIAAANE